MTEGLESSGDDFENKKRQYFANFARAHTSAFRPHWKEGETLGRGVDIWRNVSEHCLVEGVAADILAELVDLPEQDRRNVVAAELVHDWYKKHEVAAQRATEAKGSFTLKEYEATKEADDRGLRAMGVPEDVIALTGHIVAPDRNGPQTLPQKIMWYIDAITSNTELVPLLKRFENLERGWDGTKYDPERGARNLRFSELFRERYGGATNYEVVREIAGRVEPELSQLAGFDGPSEDLPLYIQSKIGERVRSFSPRPKPE